MPANNRQFSIALESYLELKEEVSALPPQGKPVSPTMRSVLTRIGPLPREALFLGLASDDLPVLLNLYDPVPGSLLVAGEAGSGKTAFLQSIARLLVQTHQPDDLQYGVVTSRPDEWAEIKNTSHCVGVFSTKDISAQDLILSMASWAHENKNSRQSVLLMIDDLEAGAKLDFDILQNLRWLLSRGPSRRVWPIVAMDAERYGQVISWIPIFRTRIFSRISDERVADALGGDKHAALNQLDVPNQFSLRENDVWVRFRLLE